MISTSSKVYIAQLWQDGYGLIRNKRMTLKSLVILLSILGVGCSSSDDDSYGPNPDEQPNATDPEGETIQFSDPDLNGTSDLARLSYPVVRDLSRELVTGAYLNIYYEIDFEVRQLIVEAIGGQDTFQNGEIPEGEVQASFACPEGGTVSASYTDRNGPTGIFTGLFANCALEGHTLTGTLVREQNSGVTGGGSYKNVAVTFDNLTIESTEKGVLNVSGTGNRSSSTSTPEMLADGERGSCVLDESNVHFVESSNLQSAVLERPEIVGSVTVSDSSYSRKDTRNYVATSNAATCPQFREANESGSAIVTFAGYGPSLLNGQATIATTIATDVQGDLSRTHTGTQATELPDSSSVLITALSDVDCQAQVDIVANAAIISFVDNYCFVALDF